MFNNIIQFSKEENEFFLALSKRIVSWLHDEMYCALHCYF